MAGKKVAIGTLDTTFRKAVRERDDHICQNPRCKHCGNAPGLNGDVAHYYGRRSRGGRWHPDNVAFLCRPWHEYIDRHEPVKVDFFRKILGEGRHQMLVERMHGQFKYTPADRWEMNQHYRAQWKYLLRRRAEGEQGPLVLTPWD